MQSADKNKISDDDEHELFKNNQNESEKMSLANESSRGRWSSSVWESG